jgi:hypothetical protein
MTGLLGSGWGPQRTGIDCPGCGHDWSFHFTYENECRFLRGGVDGYELCDCTSIPPAGMHIEILNSRGLWFAVTTGQPRSKDDEDNWRHYEPEIQWSTAGLVTVWRCTGCAAGGGGRPEAMRVQAASHVCLGGRPR